MKLEDIGFYTLSDYRAKQASSFSPLWRCELILTDKCNFKCPYCRGLRKDIQGTLNFDKAEWILNYWLDQGLKNIRFSGGEPTLYYGLEDLIKICKYRNLKHIAVSTNGSANFDYYKKLIKLGVNDFSVSLDTCCSSLINKMIGVFQNNIFEIIVNNIKNLSKLTYITIGIVVTEENIHDCLNIIKFVHDLGVADIRFIPSAQDNTLLTTIVKLPENIINRHPILRYRINNIKQKRNVRGLKISDYNKCYLALDDMLVAGNYHFPCVIYMREQGNPIGIINKIMRKQRLEWVLSHNSYNDSICKKNCLDVCIDYNNKCNENSVMIR